MPFDFSSKERIAIINLTRQGYNCWLPQISETIRSAGKFAKVEKAMFPGYVFVELNLDTQRWRPINGTIGVSHIVIAGGRPIPLPNEFVTQLNQRVELGSAGLKDTELKNGDLLKVFDGAFTDLIGQVSGLPGQERVTLLMNLMSRSVPVTISSKNVMMAV